MSTRVENYLWLTSVGDNNTSGHKIQNNIKVKYSKNRRCGSLCPWVGHLVQTQKKLVVCNYWSAKWDNGGCTVPVRHPHDHTVYAWGARLVDDGFESRDQHLAALQTKTFLRRPLPGQEVLEPGQENKSQFVGGSSSLKQRLFGKPLRGFGDWDGFQRIYSVSLQRAEVVY